MYDLIYLENNDDYVRASTETKQAFPTARIEDASDFVHPYRFSIEVNMPVEEYRLEILDLGLAFHALNFQIFMMEKPKEAKVLVEKWQAGE